MAIHHVVLFPDEILRSKCAPVDVFNEDLEALAHDLTETLDHLGAIGITAAHIGILKRVTVIRLEDTLEAYVNPVILDVSEDVASHIEGSISMPGVTESVTRPATISLRYQTVLGQIIDTSASGFLAACLQHEVDQLDGIFWLERLSRLKRERLTTRWRKQARSRE